MAGVIACAAATINTASLPWLCWPLPRANDRLIALGGRSGRRSTHCCMRKPQQKRRALSALCKNCCKLPNRQAVRQHWRRGAVHNAADMRPGSARRHRRRRAAARGAAAARPAVRPADTPQLRRALARGHLVVVPRVVGLFVLLRARFGLGQRRCAGHLLLGVALLLGGSQARLHLQARRAAVTVSLARCRDDTKRCTITTNE